MERQAHELAKALVRRGIEVQAVSARFHAGQQAVERVDGVWVNRTAWSEIKIIRFLLLPWSLVGVLWRQRRTFDVMHVHQFSGFGLAAILAGRVLNKPVLTKLLGIGPFGIAGMRESWFGRVKLAAFRLSTGVVAMCEESIAELSFIGYPLNRTLRTPNGIDTDCEVRQSETSEIGQEVRLVVYVGRLTAEKRLYDLLEAWSRLPDSIRRLNRLEIWGSGPLRSSLESRCTVLDLADQVVFRGDVNDVRGRLPRARILVLPSATEGNSNAILEAMAAGLPVVATCVGGTPMLLGEEGRHQLFNPGDIAALTGHLQKLLASPDECARIGRAMRRRVLDHFDINVIAKRYAAAYRLLVSGRQEELWTLSSKLIATDRAILGHDD